MTTAALPRTWNGSLATQELVAKSVRLIAPCLPLPPLGSGALASGAPGLGRCQLPPPVGPDLLRSTRQFVRWSHVTDRTVQAHRVIVRHELGDQPPSIVQAQGRLDSDALSFQGLEPPFHLAVALGIVGRGLDVGHPADPDELLEVPGDE